MSWRSKYRTLIPNMKGDRYDVGTYEAEDRGILLLVICRLGSMGTKGGSDRGGWFLGLCD